VEPEVTPHPPPDAIEKRGCPNIAYAKLREGRSRQIAYAKLLIKRKEPKIQKTNKSIERKSDLNFIK